MDVQEHQVESPTLEQLVGQMRIAHRRHVELSLAERPLQGPAERRLIVHDQDPRHQDATWLSWWK